MQSNKKNGLVEF